MEIHDHAQLNLFASHESKLVKWLRELDINNMTPLEAIAEIEKVQKYIMRKENEAKVY